VVYIDESGVNKHMSREYGRSPVGKRAYLPSHGRKYKKVNIVAGLLNNKVLCPTKYIWNTTSEWFNEWFEWLLCPLLRKGSIAVMDNASFHKKSVLNQIAQSYGLRIISCIPANCNDNPPTKLRK